MRSANIFTKTLALILLLITFATQLHAQNLKKDKQAAMMVDTKKLIDSQNFVFVPQFVSPLRGGTRHLTSYYALEIAKDSIMSDLPYFGRAYIAPINSSEAGFNFTSTDYEYKVTHGKKDAWDILIKPKNTAYARQLSLRIFTNASASLTIYSINRDPISYQGYVTSRKQTN